MAKRTEKLFCRHCTAERVHMLGPGYTIEDTGSQDARRPEAQYHIVECRQCGEISALKYTFEEGPDGAGAKAPYLTLYPLSATREHPLWFADLSDANLRRILSGIYQSIEKPDMVAFGARMALDRLMTLTLGVQDSFDAGLLSLQKQKKISEAETLILAPLAHIGDASQSPSVAISAENTAALLDTLETLICRLFVMGPDGEKTDISLRRRSGLIRILKTPDGRLIDFAVGFGNHPGVELDEKVLNPQTPDMKRSG